LWLPPSLREWLPEGRLAWFVIDAAAQFDLTAFYASYRADGHGQAAHEPARSVTLLLYGHTIGERSSRRLERRFEGRRRASDGTTQAPITPRSRASDAGRALYAKRQTTVEPVCANTKFKRRLSRCS